MAGPAPVGLVKEATCLSRKQAADPALKQAGGPKSNLLTAPALVLPDVGCAGR